MAVLEWRQKKTRILMVFLICCLAVRVFVGVTKGFTSVCSGSAAIEIPSPLGIGFQNDENRMVEVSVTSGLLNSSLATITVNDAGGSFTFTSLASATIKITHVNITSIKIEGDMGKETRPILSGESFQIQNGDYVFIYWYILFEPFVPFLFILGVVGLIGMFGGPAYTIVKVKNREYREGFVTGVILTVTGLALFMAWVSV